MHYLVPSHNLIMYLFSECVGKHVIDVYTCIHNIRTYLFTLSHTCTQAHTRTCTFRVFNTLLSWLSCKHIDEIHCCTSHTLHLATVRVVRTIIYDHRAMTIKRATVITTAYIMYRNNAMCPIVMYAYRTLDAWAFRIQRIRAPASAEWVGIARGWASTALQRVDVYNVRRTNRQYSNP